MKFRISGTITNLDMAAHLPVLRIRGYNHVGAVGENACEDRMHRLPILICMRISAGEEVWSSLAAGTFIPFDRTFDMAEVESVSLDQEAYFDCSYVVDLAEDPAEPVVP